MEADLRPVSEKTAALECDLSFADTVNHSLRHPDEDRWGCANGPFSFYFLCGLLSLSFSHYHSHIYFSLSSAITK